MQSTTRVTLVIVCILIVGFIAGVSITAQDAKFGAADTVVHINDLAKLYNARMLEIDIQARETKARLAGEFDGLTTRRVPGDSSKVIVPRSLFR